MLNSSEQWDILVQSGTQLRRVRPDLLEPPLHEGQIFVGSGTTPNTINPNPVILRVNGFTHQAHLMPAPIGEGHHQWLIRIAPGINVAPTATGYRINVPIELKQNIVDVEMLVSGDIAFGVTPIVPTNPKKVFEDGELEPIPPAIP